MSAVTADARVQTPSEDAAETGRPAERAPMPLPEDVRTVFLGGLFVLAVLTVLYVAAELLLPIVLAFVLNLVLQPLVRLGEKIRLPRVVGAILSMALLIAVVVGLGLGLSGPAAAWATGLVEAVPKLMQQLHVLARPLAALQNLLARVQGTSPDAAFNPGTIPVRMAGVAHTVFSGTSALAGGVFTTLLVLFYLLNFGETFLRRTVEILPRFSDKRLAVEIVLRVQRDLSAYLVTVGAINTMVGLATGTVMWACGVGNAVLWGFLACVLNFVPILGPMVGIVLFLLVSALSLGVHWFAVLPPALYFVIHVVEGEVVTPMLLARRFTINPVAVVLALVFWYWMWGVPGAVLAVPMLAIAKIICDDLPPLRAFGHFLEG
jgi:predicted PurR-regulated permease PerM